MPIEQTARFAEAAQAAGNACTHLVFDGAGHGGGALNCAAGREAALRFLDHHALLRSAVRAPAADGPRGAADATDPRDAMGGAMRAFKLGPAEYAYEDGAPFRPAVHGRATMRLRKL